MDLLDARSASAGSGAGTARPEPRTTAISRSCRRRRRALLGLGFLGLKGYEYYADWRDGSVPRTARFRPGEVDPDRLTLFMMFYFVLTGLHAVHLSIGVGLVGWLTTRAARGRPAFDSARQ